MKLSFRRLLANEIDVRVATVKEGKGMSLLLYKDARVDQNMLDETVGATNWQRSHEIIGNNLYCTVSIWDEEKKEWVSKQDVGTESKTEAEKGQASDSFKRACFNWGIGRELYTAPFIWVNTTNGIDKYTKFAVKEISYDTDGNINFLVVTIKDGAEVYRFENKTITKKKQEVLKNLCEKKGLDISTTFPTGLEKLTPSQYASAVKQLEKVKDK